MSKSDEPEFLDSVFPPVSPADEGEPPNDEEIEKPDPREAYLPDVVGPRIRNALSGGQGIGGNPRRYGMIVVLLVGLASVPSWIVLRSGVDEIIPGDRMTGDAVRVQPMPELPFIVTVPRVRTQNIMDLAEEELARPTSPRPARPDHPQPPVFVPEHANGHADPLPIAEHQWCKHKGKHHRAKRKANRLDARSSVAISPIPVHVVMRTIRVPSSRPFHRPVVLPHRARQCVRSAFRI